MNKRFFAAALTALLTLACHGNAHGHGGFGGGFHGGGFYGGGFHGGGAHFAAPRMAAPMYGGFHGGSVGGFRGAGPGFYHGPAYLGTCPRIRVRNTQVLVIKQLASFEPN